MPQNTSWQKLSSQNLKSIATLHIKAGSWLEAQSHTETLRRFSPTLANKAFFLLNASVVRVMLVPAAMILAGKWNWWFPKPLERLSRRLQLGHDA